MLRIASPLLRRASQTCTDGCGNQPVIGGWLPQPSAHSTTIRARFGWNAQLLTQHGAGRRWHHAGQHLAGRHPPWAAPSQGGTLPGQHPPWAAPSRGGTSLVGDEAKATARGVPAPSQARIPLRTRSRVF